MLKKTEKEKEKEEYLTICASEVLFLTFHACRRNLAPTMCSPDSSRAMSMSCTNGVPGTR